VVNTKTTASSPAPAPAANVNQNQVTPTDYVKTVESKEIVQAISVK
jgi:hypothetical protein